MQGASNSAQQVFRFPGNVAAMAIDRDIARQEIRRHPGTDFPNLAMAIGVIEKQQTGKTQVRLSHDIRQAMFAP